MKISSLSTELHFSSFESVVDDNTQEITNYCLPGLLTLLTNTTGFVHEVNRYSIGFFCVD